MSEKSKPSELERVLYPRIRRVLTQYFKQEDFRDEWFGFESPEAPVIHGFDYLTVFATWAHRLHQSPDGWFKKVNQQREERLAELSVDGADYIEETFCLYLIGIGDFLTFFERIEAFDFSAQQRLLMKAALKLAERGEKEASDQVISRVDLTRRGGPYFGELLKIYEKQGNKIGLASMQAEIEKILNLVAVKLQDMTLPLPQRRGLQTTARFLEGHSEKARQLENGITTEYIPSRQPEVAELYGRLHKVRKFLGSGELEQAVGYARQLIADVQKLVEEKPYFSVEKVHFSNALAECFIPYPEYHYMIEECLADRSEGNFSLREAFPVWVKLKDKEKLRTEYQRGLELFTEQIPELNIAYAWALHQLDSAAATAFIQTLPEKKDQLAALAKIVEFSLEKGLGLPDWRAKVDQMEKVEPETELTSYEQEDISVSTAIARVGHAAIDKDDFTTLSQVLADRRLITRSIVGLLEHVERVA